MSQKPVDPQLAHLIGGDPRRQRLSEHDRRQQEEIEKQQKAAKEAEAQWLASYNPAMCIMLTIPLSGAVYYCHENRDPVAQKNKHLLAWPGQVGLRYGRLYSVKEGPSEIDSKPVIKIHNEVDFIGTGVISETVVKPGWWNETVERGLKEDSEYEKAREHKK